MKKLIILCFIGLLFNSINAQNLNTELTDSKNRPFLVGEINKNGLTTDNYNAWFSKNHDEYKIDSDLVNQLKPLLKNYDITLFMGTWCGDSKKEVPRFYKVLEQSNFPMNQLKVIAVSREKGAYKKSPNHEEKGLNIHRVPTFIIYKNNIEVNRIVEHPKESIESDLLNIITHNNYTPNYPIVAEVDAILKNKGAKGLKRQSKSLIKNFKDTKITMSHLNTYAYILFQDDRKKESIEVSILNTKLFPDHVKTHQNLANKYYNLNKKRKAKKHYNIALKLDPENKSITQILEKL